MNFDADGVVVRIGHSVESVWPRESTQWARKAARAFAAQLHDCRAATLAAVMEPIAVDRGFSDDEIEALGIALELLQVAFDFADNVADEDADLAAGRTFARAYRGIPPTVRPCMPAMFVATALTRIVDRFPAPRFTVAHALNRLTAVLASMMTGQGERTNEPRRVARIAGDQGLLLCLPWWLTKDQGDPDPRGLEQIERWAVCLGCVWEYTQRVREDPNSMGAWQASVRRLHSAWPTFGPFVGDGSLAVHHVIPPAIS